MPEQLPVQLTIKQLAMDFIVQVILSWSIAFAAIIGLAKANSMAREDLPVLVIFITGLLNEVLSLYTIRVFHNNAVNCNIYVLLETMLFFWLFANWTGRRRTFIMLSGLMLACWIADNFYFNTIYQFLGFYRFTYYFLLALIAIVIMHRQLATYRLKPLWNGRFIICIAVIASYAANCFIEVFYIIDFNIDVAFEKRLFTLISVINFLSNILYAWAIVCLTMKPRYMLRLYWQ